MFFQHDSKEIGILKDVVFADFDGDRRKDPEDYLIDTNTSFPSSETISFFPKIRG